MRMCGLILVLCAGAAPVSAQSLYLDNGERVVEGFRQETYRTARLSFIRRLR